MRRHRRRLSRRYGRSRRPKVKIVLTAYNMGDVSEADFDAWASWVAAHVDEACGVDASVDQYPFRGGPSRDTVYSADEDARDAVRRWLATEGWDEFWANA
jgi:hypothetical protein